MKAIYFFTILLILTSTSCEPLMSPYYKYMASYTPETDTEIYCPNFVEYKKGDANYRFLYSFIVLKSTAEEVHKAIRTAAEIRAKNKSTDDFTVLLLNNYRSVMLPGITPEKLLSCNLRQIQKRKY